MWRADREGERVAEAMHACASDSLNTRTHALYLETCNKRRPIHDRINTKMTSTERQYSIKLQHEITT